MISNRRPSLAASRVGHMDRPYGQVAEPPCEAGRLCSGCGTWLSRWNTGERCGACELREPTPVERFSEGTIPDRILDRLEEGPATFAQLRDECEINPGSLHKAMSRLRNVGLVITTSDPKDKRGVYQPFTYHLADGEAA